MNGSSEIRRWTIASWRVDSIARERAAILDGLAALDIDAIALQHLSACATRSIAESLDLLHTWARSHYPVSRLIPGSSLGLAVLTPHRIIGAAEQPTTADSLWSSDRRSVQTVSVMRSDHSAYSIIHGSAEGGGPVVVDREPDSPPMVTIRSGTTPHDPPTLELPGGASGVTVELAEPIPGGPPLTIVEFEMIWVQGDFASF